MIKLFLIIAVCIPRKVYNMQLLLEHSFSLMCELCVIFYGLAYLPQAPGFEGSPRLLCGGSPGLARGGTVMLQLGC